MGPLRYGYGCGFEINLFLGGFPECNNFGKYVLCQLRTIGVMDHLTLNSNAEFYVASDVREAKF